MCVTKICGQNHDKSNSITSYCWVGGNYAIPHKMVICQQIRDLKGAKQKSISLTTPPIFSRKKMHPPYIQPKKYKIQMSPKISGQNSENYVTSPKKCRKFVVPPTFGEKKLENISLPPKISKKLCWPF